MLLWSTAPGLMLTGSVSTSRHLLAWGTLGLLSRPWYPHLYNGQVGTQLLTFLPCLLCTCCSDENHASSLLKGERDGVLEEAVTKQKECLSKGEIFEYGKDHKARSARAHSLSLPWM